MKIRLIMDSGEASGEIVDSVAGRDFLSLLPVTLSMYDLFGREKPGQLPRELQEADGGRMTFSAGEIAYWPPLHDIAFFYTDDDGTEPMPETGTVQLGTVTSGLEVIAAAGDPFTLTIERDEDVTP